MKIVAFSYDFTVCKINDIKNVDLSNDFTFLEKTDEEISLVCRTQFVPDNTVCRDDGWNAFKIDGILDFSLIGILSKIASILADAKISIFAVSTYNTDYVLVRRESFDEALKKLSENGYEILHC